VAVELSNQHRLANANERRCKAETKRGRCRVTRGLNAQGLCSMHAGTSDPSVLGKLSGEARRKPNSDRVPEGLRSYLKREAEPATVWHAIQSALDGESATARVSASKLLLDALYEPAPDTCPVCRQREENPVDVEAKLLALLGRSDPPEKAEHEQERRAMLHAELAPVAEFDSHLAARVEQAIADRL
jgi:hypothetical protein